MFTQNFSEKIWKIKLCQLNIISFFLICDIFLLFIRTFHNNIIQSALVNDTQLTELLE